MTAFLAGSRGRKWAAAVRFVRRLAVPVAVLVSAFLFGGQALAAEGWIAVSARNIPATNGFGFAKLNPRLETFGELSFRFVRAGISRDGQRIAYLPAQTPTEVRVANTNGAGDHPVS